MGNRPNSRRTLRRQPGILDLRWCCLVTALLLASATNAAAQAVQPNPPTVEVRIHLTWDPALNSHESAVVVIEPATHSTAPQQLRLTPSSGATVRLAPGRYQLTTTTPLVIGHQAYGWNIELALFDPVNNIQLSQENAVRLAAGDVIEPASPHLQTANAPATMPDSSTAVDARSQLLALLNRWTDSLRARDLRTQMSCYAPHLPRYLERRNVSWTQLQTQKRRLFDLYTQIRVLNLSDIDLTISQDQAEATAVMKWDFTDHEVESRGNAQVNFEFEQIGSRWLITSEWQGPPPERLNSAAVH